jgi:hypothetical protein
LNVLTGLAIAAVALAALWNLEILNKFFLIGEAGVGVIGGVASPIEGWVGGTVVLLM